MQLTQKHTWKMAIVTGSICGILLTLLQLTLLFYGNLFPSLAPLILLGLLLYMVGSGTVAFFTTHLTQQEHAGYTASRLTALLCAITLVLTLIIGNALYPLTHFQGGYKFALFPITENFFWVVFISLNIVGVFLSLIGAFFGTMLVPE